jgi:signal peptidase II
MTERSHSKLSSNTSNTSSTSYKRLLITVLIVFTTDQLTKIWIFNTMALDSYFYPHDADVIEVIKNFFYIVHIGNEGAAWGMFSGHGEILALFALVALATIYKFRHALELHRKTMQLAFGLLIGGVLGNLVDRLVHGHVIDFLDFHLGFTIPWVLPHGRYPAFNVADCGIVIGVFAYIILSFFQTEASEEKT